MGKISDTKDSNKKNKALIGRYLNRLIRSLYIPQTALLTVDFEPHNSMAE